MLNFFLSKKMWTNLKKQNKLKKLLCNGIRNWSFSAVCWRPVQNRAEKDCLLFLPIEPDSGVLSEFFFELYFFHQIQLTKTTNQQQQKQWLSF